jgi:ABC-type amino acid transport substrate-binding protein
LTELWTALECAQIEVVVVEQSYARAMQQQDPTLRVGMALSFAPYVVVLPYDALYLNDALNRSLQRADDTGTLTALAARWMSMPPVICPSP